MPKAKYIPSLLSLFRQYGYDGATLSKISTATGLGKASLYHHFPGGKDDMVAAVLAAANDWLQDNVLKLLEGSGSPHERLQQMCDHIDELYAGGAHPCVLARLQTGTGQPVAHAQTKTLIATWSQAIATVLVAAGLDETLAQQRGQDALIAVQGALMVSQAIDDTALFRRTIQQLPQQLLRPA
ncbi:MAG: TetR/AcrR family transcriptional regulator [Cyanobacteria bacterium J06632_22]